MIYYRQIKDGHRSKFQKIITHPETNELIDEVTVSLPVITTSEAEPFILLYDDNMKVLLAPTSYVNFDLSQNSFNTRKNTANALRLLYVFLSLTGYRIDGLGQEELTELIHFLQGLDHNPNKYQSDIIRSNATVNGYLSTYRSFFKKKKIYSSALFDSKIVKTAATLPSDSMPIVDRVVYTNNLKVSDRHSHNVPKLCLPEF